MRSMRSERTILIVVAVIWVIFMIGICCNHIYRYQSPKVIEPPLQMSIEHGIPYLLYRPLNAPTVLIRCYDLEACLGTWVERQGVRGEDSNGEYLEICWGK